MTPGLLAALFVAACSPTPGDPDSDGAPSAAAATNQFSEVDPTLLGNFQEGSLSNETARVSAVTFPVLADPRNAQLAIELAMDRGLRNHAMAAADDYQQAWSLIGSSPAALGILLTTTTAVDGQDQIAPLAVWYDPSTDRGVAGPGLITIDAWDSFVGEVLDRAPGQAEEQELLDALATQAMPYGNGPAIGFNGNGDLLVQFSSELLEGPVVIPASVASDLLSPFGSDAQEAASSPTAFVAGEADEREREEALGGEDNEAAAAGSSEVPEVIQIPEGPGGSGGGAATEPEETRGEAVRPYPWVGVNCEAFDCVAMTYDDGPTSGSSDVSAAYLQAGAAATFFQIGEVVAARGEVTSLLAAQGMQIGTHSQTHVSLLNLSGDALTEQFTQPAELMREHTGRPPLFMRAPLGLTNERVREAAGENGVALVSWTVDTRDWANTPGDATASTASTVNANGIVIMHDTQSATVDIAGDVAEAAVDADKLPVTVAELSDYSWDPGAVYPAGAYGS